MLGDELNDELARGDTRRLKQLIEDDVAFEEYDVTRVEKSENVLLLWNGIVGRCVEPGHDGRYPLVETGDRVRVYLDHNAVAGWALNGRVIAYLTPLERLARRVSWLAALDRREREHGASSNQGPYGPVTGM
jgi:hypothetical protein